MSEYLKIFDPPNWPAIAAVGTWLAGIGTIFAVFVALNLSRRDAKSRRIERRGQVVAMCVDIFHARKSMRALIEEDIMAPLYRLPDSSFLSGLPKVIGDGLLEGNEIAALHEYARKIAEINRGLDRAGAAHAAQPPGGSEHLKNEFVRNQAKAREVLEPQEDGNEPLIDQAEGALDRLELKYSPWWTVVEVRCKAWLSERVWSKKVGP